MDHSRLAEQIERALSGMPPVPMTLREIQTLMEGLLSQPIAHDDVDDALRELCTRETITGLSLQGKPGMVVLGRSELNHEQVVAARVAAGLQ